ncbi:Adhesion G-protein coupled receptor G6 [Holothuria leucospilota]|uniref:Adhesion G-protein coupled receptor G6 n=1 Tax=Holothuria leucospilota TaxID=206669 RepID=A0A9Q0YHN6_HOLLE|nr:Adhesion G-protein coupled receptor G6 [Holothuria leucospilota]
MAGDLAINHPTHCKNIATATHFFCLATFAWMSAEAINMYLVFVKIGKPRLEYFLLVSCVLTYGKIIFALFALNNLYSTRYEDMLSCFLHPGYSLYFGLILEIFLLLVLNTVIFILVIKKVVFRPILSTSARNNKKKEVVARIQQFILFWVLLGLSWTFGFLTLIPNRLTFAFELLFCIFISLQGVVLSIFIFMKNPEVRNSLRKAKERLSMKSSNALSNDSTGSSSHSKFNVILLRFTHRKSSNNDKSSKSTSSL